MIEYALKWHSYALLPSVFTIDLSQKLAKPQIQTVPACGHLFAEVGVDTRERFKFVAAQ